MRHLIWRSAAARALAVVLLLNLLAACRVDTVTSPTVGYPGPVGKPTKVATTAPRANTVAPKPATVAPPPAPTVGAVAFSLTIVHEAEVQGEAIPCG
jgi:hypothetical protein